LKSNFTTLACGYCRCTQNPRRDDDNCSTGKSQIKNKCHCKSDCEIAAGNNVFGDPCGRTYKYINITYICVWANGN